MNGVSSASYPCRISAKLFSAEKKFTGVSTTVLLLLRLNFIVYIVTHPKTGTRSKMNINPASSAAGE